MYWTNHKIYGYGFAIEMCLHDETGIYRSSWLVLDFAHRHHAQPAMCDKRQWTLSLYRQPLFYISKASGVACCSVALLTILLIWVWKCQFCHVLDTLATAVLLIESPFFESLVFSSNTVWMTRFHKLAVPCRPGEMYAARQMKCQMWILLRWLFRLNFHHLYQCLIWFSQFEHFELDTANCMNINWRHKPHISVHWDSSSEICKHGLWNECRQQWEQIMTNDAPRQYIQGSQWLVWQETNLSASKLSQFTGHVHQNNHMHIEVKCMHCCGHLRPPTDQSATSVWPCMFAGKLATCSQS